jgi:hypothetical protein
LCLVCPALAQNAAAPQGSQVTIEVPGTKSNVVSLQTAGAWPLTIRLLANRPIGIATVTVPDAFPVGTQRAFIVFVDPDGCFSQTLDQLDPGPLTEPCPNGPDETFLEFAPDLNLPGVAKSGGYEDDPIVCPPEPALCPVAGLQSKRLALGEPQTVPAWDSATNTNADQASTGPATGGAALDNYGYGASPNVPGLVILSDTGVGNVWEEDLVGGVLKGVRLVKPRVARNLAGFINFVSWTLNDRMAPTPGRSSVTAHMTVPFALMRPVTLADFDAVDMDGNGTLDMREAWRIDGGPLTIGTASYGLVDALNRHVTTLRIFAVSGQAPDEFVDQDGNGRVDIRDAALTPGVTLLSRETIVRFQTLNQDVAAGYAVLFDFFGDGLQPPPAPAGSGGIRDIPR